MENENLIKKAQEMFEKGISVNEISKNIKKDKATVYRWINKFSWKKQKKEPNKTTKLVNSRKKLHHGRADPGKKEVNEVLKNEKLTDKQKLFCLLYSKSLNAVSAYLKAFDGCSYNTALCESSKLKKNPDIAIEIEKLKKMRFEREYVSENDIYQKYFDIAFADITDYVKFDTKKIEFLDKNGEKKVMEVSEVNVKKDTEVDGTIITEISKGRDGFKIKLADRMKALDWLSNHSNINTEREKVEIDLIKSKIETEVKTPEEEKTETEIENILKQINPVDKEDMG